MFDLEDCKDVSIDNCETTADTLIKGRRIEGLSVTNSNAGLSELSKLGVPVDAMTDVQLAEFIKTFTNESSKTWGGKEINNWLEDTAVFTTLAADVKATLMGACMATVKLGYQKLKSKL